MITVVIREKKLQAGTFFEARTANVDPELRVRAGSFADVKSFMKDKLVHQKLDYAGVEWINAIYYANHPEPGLTWDLKKEVEQETIRISGVPKMENPPSPPQQTNRREEDKHIDIARPSHYGGENNPFEAIKIIEYYNLNFSQGNILKLLLRADKKGQEMSDVIKMKQYAEFEVRRVEKKQRDSIKASNETL